MLRAILATVAAIIGGSVLLFIRELHHKLLCAMVSLAAGALFAVAILNILPEAAEISSWPSTLISAAIGLILFYLVGKYVYFLCPACAASELDESKGYMHLGILMIIAMILHSLTDGMALAIGSEVKAKVVGLLILIAVTYHKVPEGLALTSVSVMSGMNRYKALIITALVETTTALGAFLGLTITQNIPQKLLGIPLGLVAGAFLYIVSFAIFHEMHEHEKKSIILYSGIGFISIVIWAFALRGVVGAG